MATSIPASANSPANIRPVGPPPAITTACLVMSRLLCLPAGGDAAGRGPPYGKPPWGLYSEVGGAGACDLAANFTPPQSCAARPGRKRRARLPNWLERLCLDP